MKKLQSLELRDNSLIELPDWFYQLQSLTDLHLDGNSSLTRLHPHVASLHTFTDEECDSITEPPSAVCQGGLEDIRQYYNDLKEGSAEIVLSTIVLIGRKEAGKSTLLRAMQNGFSAEAMPEDVKKTSVFEFQKVNLKHFDDRQELQTQEVQIIDFGGDDVYHYAYQLTFRDNCIPIVVANIKEYEQKSKEWGPREAARRVAFDWLSHLLIVSPTVEMPLLVLTHVDKLASEEVERLRKELLSTLEDLRRDFLEGRDRPEIKMLDHRHSKMFELDHIFNVGYGTSEHSERLGELQKILYAHVKAKKQTVPKIWDEEMKRIKGNTQSCIKYSDLQKPHGHGNAVLNVLLGYMKRSGLILQYSDGQGDNNRSVKSPISGVIFHNIPAVAKLISTLYHDLMDERIIIGNKASLQKSNQTERRMDSFVCNGIVSADVLNIILRDTASSVPNEARQQSIIPEGSSCIPFDIAMKLLSKFRLLYGPQSVNRVESYLVPYFMQKHSFPDNSAEFRLHGTISFHGLVVPNYE